MRKQTLIYSFLLVLIFSRDASALFPKSTEKTYDVFSVKTPEYRVLFTRTGTVRKRHAYSGKEEQWTELSFKFSNLKDEPKTLFADSGWGEIRFLDENGFWIARTVVTYADLIGGRDYYGRIWVKSIHLGKIKSADLIPVQEEDALGIRKEQEKFEDQKKEEPVVEEKSAEPPFEDGLERGGITNEDVEDTLKTFELQTPTVIESSPTEITEGSEPAATSTS